MLIRHIEPKLIVKSNVKKQSGLTLLEVMVAVAIMAVIAVLSYQTLSVSLDSSDIVEEHLQEMRRLDRAWALIENDLNNVIAHKRKRDASEAASGDLPAMVVDGTDPRWLVLLRGGYATNIGSANITLKRPEVVRVAYRLEEGVLWRDIWYNTGLTEVESAKHRKLLDGIESIEISALSREATSVDAGPWLDSWGIEPSQIETLPYALRIGLTLENDDKIERLFKLLDGR